MVLTLSALLGRGYFPKELPPQFATSKYAARLASPGAGVPTDSPPRNSLCADHSLGKGGAVRRQLRLPNPVHFYRLAEHVVGHWEPLRQASTSSPYSLTGPELVGDRALNLANSLRARVGHRARIRADGRYLVRADVTRFYSSIYTHSVPWAVLGKDEAKRRFNTNTLSGEWSDKLDRLVRKLNGDQTAGIPIGPDTSLLIAEILLGAVDREVNLIHPNIQGIRYIDDYEFVTHTRDEAEAVLGSLQVALRAFELELNASKTAICELPVWLTEGWVSALRRHHIEQEKPVAQHEDLAGYFGTAFQMMKDHPEEQVLKYALGRVKHLEVHPDNWTFYEHLLQQCAGADPSCLPLVGADLEYYRHQGRTLNPRWGAVLNRVVARQLPLGYSSEAAWAMCLLLQFALAMSADAAAAVGKTDDSVAAIMGALLARAGLVPWTSLAGLQRFVHPQHLYGQQWLWCYEASIWQWLGGSSSVLAGDPWFGYFAQGASDDIVTFVNPGATVAPADKYDADEQEETEEETY